MWYHTQLALMYCLSTYVPEKCLVFKLRSKVELNWTRAIRPVIAQSVQFSNIDKKTEHRFVPIIVANYDYYLLKFCKAN